MTVIALIMDAVISEYPKKLAVPAVSDETRFVWDFPWNFSAAIKNHRKILFLNAAFSACEICYKWPNGLKFAMGDWMPGIWKVPHMIFGTIFLQMSDELKNINNIFFDCKSV